MSKTAMTVQCELCPKQCLIAPGESGECRIRVNMDGKLRAVTYGYPGQPHLDPVEKKPLFHFLPGTRILSLATVGCNLHCRNCQNWQISQCNPEDSSAVHFPPGAIPRVAANTKVRSVAYTYTEPVVFYEYTLDSCRKAHEAGLKNVLVTAAYINQQPWKELCRHVAAANIDLKSMSDSFYRRICDARLKPVLNALVTARDMGVMVEVTHLLIPTLNDAEEDIRELCRWIREHLGRETPLHISRFFPQYKMRHLPPTPADKLRKAREIARAEGLYYPYVGNIMIENAQNTFCPECDRTLVRRVRYTVEENNLINGRCPNCNSNIYGLWK